MPFKHKIMLKSLEPINVYEFRVEDYETEFWETYRGEKTKPKITIYKNTESGKYLLCLSLTGKLFPKWEAIASLVKFCCMVERTNTGNIINLKSTFNELGLSLEEITPTKFSNLEE